MDFIPAYYKIRSNYNDIYQFRTNCRLNRQFFLRILDRFKMNVGFVIADRTYPYTLINLSMLVNKNDNKLFEILMSQSRYASEKSGNYIYFFFYLSSTSITFTDQRMFWYEENNDRFQNIIEVPSITSGQITYLTNVAYYTQAFTGDYFALYRVGKNLLTPLNEITDTQWYQFYQTQLLSNPVVNSNNIRILQNSNSNNYVGNSPWRFLEDDTFGLSNLYFKNSNPFRQIQLFLITKPEGFRNCPIDYDYNVNPNNTRQQVPVKINNLINYINQPNLLSNEMPNMFNTLNFTLSSVSQILTDQMSFYAALGSYTKYSWPDMEIINFPVLFPTALVKLVTNSDSLEIKGYMNSMSIDKEYFGVGESMVPYTIDSRCQDNIWSTRVLYDSLSNGNSYSFDDASTLIRVGNGNLLSNQLRPEVIRNYVRMEIYPFDLTQYSEFVKLKVTGLSSDDVNITMSKFKRLIFKSDRTRGVQTIEFGLATSLVHYSRNFLVQKTSGLRRNVGNIQVNNIPTNVLFGADRTSRNLWLIQKNPSYTNANLGLTNIPMTKCLVNSLGTMPAPANFTLNTFQTLPDSDPTQLMGILFNGTLQNLDYIFCQYIDYVTDNPVYRQTPSRDSFYPEFKVWISPDNTFLPLPLNMKYIGQSLFNGDIGYVGCRNATLYIVGVADKFQRHTWLILLEIPPNQEFFLNKIIPLDVCFMQVGESATARNLTAIDRPEPNIVTINNRELINETLQFGSSIYFTKIPTVAETLLSEIKFTMSSLYFNQTNSISAYLKWGTSSLFRNIRQFPDQSFYFGPKVTLNVPYRTTKILSGQFTDVMLLWGIEGVSRQNQILSPTDRQIILDSFENLSVITTYLAEPYFFRSPDLRAADETFFDEIWSGNEKAYTPNNMSIQDNRTYIYMFNIDEYNNSYDQLSEQIYLFNTSLVGFGSVANNYRADLRSSNCLNIYQQVEAKFPLDSGLAMYEGLLFYYFIFKNDVNIVPPANAAQNRDLRFKIIPSYLTHVPNITLQFILDLKTPSPTWVLSSNFVIQAYFKSSAIYDIETKFTNENITQPYNFFNRSNMIDPHWIIKCDNQSGVPQFEDRFQTFDFIIYTLNTSRLTRTVLLSYLNVPYNGFLNESTIPITGLFPTTTDPVIYAEIVIHEPVQFINGYTSAAFDISIRDFDNPGGGDNEYWAGEQVSVSRLNLNFYHVFDNLPMNKRINILLEKTEGELVALTGQAVIVDLNQPNPDPTPVQTYKTISIYNYQWPQYSTTLFIDIPPITQNIVPRLYVNFEQLLPIVNRPNLNLGITSSFFYDLDPNNTIYTLLNNNFYIELPLTRDKMNFWGSVFLNNPQRVSFYIQLDLQLFGGKRDYIWQQFQEFTAMAFKEGDFANLSNMQVLTDNAENYGYQSEYYTQLYQQYNGSERFFWNKWMKKTTARFLTSFSPIRLQDFEIWDYKLKRYLVIFFR